MRWILLPLIVIVLSACAAPAAPPDSTGYPPEGPAPVNGDFRSDPAEAVGVTGRPQLIEFYTEWCYTCNQIKADVHRLERQFWGDVDFVYIERDNPANQQVVDSYGVVGQPVLVLVDAQGDELSRWYGEPDLADLRAALRDAR
ncbi:MAG: hypothetical protein GYB64_12145 [Chloroflexi bacterium]|nr:hypothetical protein [Chloroflexota bacterium]